MSNKQNILGRSPSNKDAKYRKTCLIRHDNAKIMIRLDILNEIVVRSFIAYYLHLSTSGQLCHLRRRCGAAGLPAAGPHFGIIFAQ